MFAPLLRLALVLALVITGIAPAHALQVEKLDGKTMGSSWVVKLVADPSVLRGTHALIQSELDLIEQQTSTWRASSDLSKFNASSAKSWHPLPRPMLELIELALKFARVSDGAYDPTIGPLVELWGFGASGHRQSLPTEEQIAIAKLRVDWRALRIDHERGRLWQPGGLALDLSSIVPGNAADRICALLDSQGIRRYLVDISGEMRARGLKPDGRPWTVAIETPDGDDRAAGIATAVELRNQALATSGNYRNRYRIGGHAFAHSVDPRSGWPVEHDLVSVSIVHASAARADAWATLLLVLGPDAAKKMVRREKLSALLILRDGKGFKLARFGQFRSNALTMGVE